MTNTLLCEKRMSHYTSTCFEANNIIARNTREFSSDPRIPNVTVVVKRAHDLMLDYIKEATQGLSKMSMNRIRRVSMGKDEWDALQAFENVASEQQKGYARAYCKPVLKSYHKKKKNFDLVAAHISHDVIPEILPQYDFSPPVYETSLPSEQAHENRESMHKLSRDFRVKATELYLKIPKEEFEFQEGKLRGLLEDFPSASRVTDEDDRVEHINDHEQDEGVLIQRHLPQRLRIIYEIRRNSTKKSSPRNRTRSSFLAERGVNETPFVLQDARDLNPALRKDVVLQASLMTVT